MTGATRADPRWPVAVLGVVWLQLAGAVALALVGSEIETLDHTLRCIRAGFGSVMPAVGRILTGSSEHLVLLALASHVLPIALIGADTACGRRVSLRPQLVATTAELVVLFAVWLGMTSTVVNLVTATNCYCG